MKEITVMILRPSDKVNIFRLGPNDFGVENIFDEHVELNLIIEGENSQSTLPSIKIIELPHRSKKEIIAVPIVESGEFRWGGKFIYAFHPKYYKFCNYPIPLWDRRNINLFERLKARS